MFSNDSIQTAIKNINNLLSFDRERLALCTGIITHEINTTLQIHELFCISESSDQIFIYLLAENGAGVCIIHRGTFGTDLLPTIGVHVREIIRSYLIGKNITPIGWIKGYLGMT